MKKINLGRRKYKSFRLFLKKFYDDRGNKKIRTFMLSVPFKHSLPIKKKLALVAHDTQKDSMVHWCQKHLKQLKKHHLFATGTTGELLEQKCGLKIKKFVSGPLGGDQQIGASIVEKKVNMLIFFWDPLEPMPHDPDIKALLRVATMWNIPIACNKTTADFLIKSPLMGKNYKLW